MIFTSRSRTPWSGYCHGSFGILVVVKLALILAVTVVTTNRCQDGLAELAPCRSGARSLYGSPSSMRSLYNKMPLVAEWEILHGPISTMFGCIKPLSFAVRRLRSLSMTDLPLHFHAVLVEGANSEMAMVKLLDHHLARVQR